jgi:hypothetical protein
MTMESTVASWLRYSQLHHVDFRVPGLHVDQHLFDEVATAIAQGRVPLTTWRQRNQGDRGYARYQAESDTLVLPSSSHGDMHRFRSLIVHEAVHVYTDMHHTRMDYMVEEAAGYLAQVLFLKRCDRSDALDFGNDRGTAIVREAWRVATAHDLNRESGEGGGLTRADLGDLITNIGRIGEYAEQARSHPRGDHHNGLIRRDPNESRCWFFCGG